MGRVWLLSIIACSLCPPPALSDDESNAARGRRLNNLAALHIQRGNYPDAERLLQESVTAYESEGGTLPIDASTALSNLAEVYRLTGRLNQSRTTLEKSLDLRQKLLGPQHPLVANTLNALSCLMLDVRQDDQAIRYASRAVAIRDGASDTNDAQYIAMHHNLGEAYRRLHDWENAEASYEKARELRRRLFGESSLEYALSLHFLGALRLDQGRWTEALQLNREALRIRESQVGASDPVTASSLNNVALVYLKSGNLEYALATARRAVDIWQGNRIRSLSLVEGLMNLAEIENVVISAEQAATTYTRIIDLLREVSPDHRYLVQAYVSLGKLLAAQEKLLEAETVLRNALILDAGRSSHADTGRELASVLRRQGRLDEAVRLEESLSVPPILKKD